ncbi:IclR family transcriptional regulator domain-containing protein [Streptomyces lichenis]|uniref:Helix-turn-helix domain-containing protein n=1 Tax=Streptomyces lichenis TaxID=2306967 RepID=A0ABT0IC69_9ACTN|nr:IclR family transcriptional regulator C-terminal domain-containing protein [Streptomyces lichenis]MCK8678923.1 helix-turn-helix domain-containing protein [Streptomyces lichenis]
MPSLVTAPEAVPAEAVAPLTRGLAVLRALSEAGGTLSLSGLQRATALARSSVDRAAGTLAVMDYVRLEGRQVALTPRLMELGNAYLDALRLPELLRERADRLADDLDESVSLAVPDGDAIRFIHQATRRRAMALSFRIGDRLPAERTAPGPLFAAGWSPGQWTAWRSRQADDPYADAFPFLPHRPGPPERDFRDRAAAARTDGWVLDDQLIEPGLVALAVPLPLPAGSTPCALSVVSHTSRHSAAALRARLLPRLRAAAGEMAEHVARAPDRPPVPAGGSLASWTTASKQDRGPLFVESLARGLTVVTAFDGQGPLTLSAVAELTGLSRATARRALITLAHLGYVATEGRAHRLTPRVLDLGYPLLAGTTLAQLAEPHLRRLSGQVGESASLAVLDDTTVQYTARAATRRIMNVNLTVGTRLPAYATSLGRVLLADLPPAERTARLARIEPAALTPRTLTRRSDLEAALAATAAAGYCLVDGELEAGLRSLAVPVRDRAGRAVAACNVALHSGSRTLDECREEILPRMRDAVGLIEEDLHTAERFVRVAPA